MRDHEIIQKYYEYAGDEFKQVQIGLYHYSVKQVTDLLQQCMKENKKLEFYYASDEDRNIDSVSHRLVSK